MVKKQRRAKTGGEVGANGDLYRGGEFIANTPMPKVARRKATTSTRRFEIAPYTHEVAPSGDVCPIYPMLKGCVLNGGWDAEKRTCEIEWCEDFARIQWRDSPEEIPESREMFNRYKNGERWYKPENCIVENNIIVRWPK